MKNTVSELKAVALALGLSGSGNKGPLFNRIRDCTKEAVTKVEDPVAFDYRREKQAEGDVPKWILLTPAAAEEIAGMDMATGAQIGHFAPTNKEDAIGAQKNNYMVHATEKVKRLEFATKPSRKTKKAKLDESEVRKVSEEGGPSAEAKRLIPDLRHARPKDFFDLQVTPEFVEKVMVNCTNQRAASEGAGAGGTTYTDWKPFDCAEMYKMIGLLFVNSLYSKPSLDLWFLITSDNRLFGNNYVAAAMNKVLPRGERIRGF